MLRRSFTNFKNHVRTQCLLVLKIMITVTETEEWKKTHKTYFSLHRLFTLGHVFWVL